MARLYELKNNDEQILIKTDISNNFDCKAIDESVVTTLLILCNNLDVTSPQTSIDGQITAIINVQSGLSFLLSIANATTSSTKVDTNLAS